MTDAARRRLSWAIGVLAGSLTILSQLVPIAWRFAMDDTNDAVRDLNARVWHLEHPGEQGPPPAPGMQGLNSMQP